MADAMHLLPRGLVHVRRSFLGPVSNHVPGRMSFEFMVLDDMTMKIRRSRGTAGRILAKRDCVIKICGTLAVNSLGIGMSDLWRRCGRAVQLAASRCGGRSRVVQ